MEEKIKEYNDLVEEWNRRFSHLCHGIPIEKSIDTNISSRLEYFKRDEMSPKNKLKITRDVVGDFANTGSYSSKPDGELTRGELALLISNKSDEILDNYKIL